MTNVIVETAHASKNALVDTVGDVDVALELGIGRFSENSENDGVGGCHVFSDIFQVVDIRIPLQLDFDLFSEGSVVGEEQLRLYYEWYT